MTELREALHMRPNDIDLEDDDLISSEVIIHCCQSLINLDD